MHIGREEEDIGAGDQGIMFGYATDETTECMPLTIVLAHKLNAKIAEYRRSGVLAWARPDTKTQVNHRVWLQCINIYEICTEVTDDVSAEYRVEFSAAVILRVSRESPFAAQFRGEIRPRSSTEKAIEGTVGSRRRYILGRSKTSR